MKAEKVAAAFVPIVLNITLETAAEAEELYTVFNATMLTRHLKHLQAEKIRDALGDKYHTRGGTQELADKVRGGLMDHG